MMNLTVPEEENLMRPRIVVFGVGGAGQNAISHMIRLGVDGIEFVSANTDAQALSNNLAPTKIQLGVSVTRGLGAGARPDVGREAAEEQLDEIGALLDGANMVFITAGMGGGTGTGGAPVIARAARERGILTVGVVTKPFHFEGAVRMRSAEAGIQALQQYVDTLIVIPNQNLFNVANEKTTFSQAFKMADDVLYQGVSGITNLIMTPGQINLDFADIRSVMSEMGKAMMGTGEAQGENRARQAAEMAINNPLLDDASIKGARGVLINITGGDDLTLFEVEEAADRIRDEVDADANIIFGTALDSSMDGKIRISVVATGIDLQSSRQRPPLEVVGGSAVGNTNIQDNTSSQSAAAGGLPTTPNAWNPHGGNAPQKGKSLGMGLFAAAQPASQPMQTASSFDTPATGTTGTRAQQGNNLPMSSTLHPTANFYSNMMPEAQGNALRVSQPTETMPETMSQPMASSRSQHVEGMPASVRGGRQGDRFYAPAPVQAPRMPQNEQDMMMKTLSVPSVAPVQSQRKVSFGQRMLGKVKQFVNAIEGEHNDTQQQPAQQQIAPMNHHQNAYVPQQQPVTQHQHSQQIASNAEYMVTQGGRASLPTVDESDIVIPAFLRRQRS